MLTLKEWLECIGYKISEGAEYQWNCFPNAYILDYWDGAHVSSSVTYDTKTYEIIFAEVCDYRNNRAYRFFNGNNAAILNKFVVENDKSDYAWSNDVDGHADLQILFTALETKEDFLEKCKAIINYEAYSTDIQVPIELDSDVLYDLMKIAHNRNITLNQLVNSILEEHLS